MQDKIDPDSLRLLDFHRILEEIASYGRSPSSKELILSLRPLQDIREIESRFALVSEIRRLLSRDEFFIDEFDDIGGLLQKLRPEGAFLEPLELYSLRKVFMNIERLGDIKASEKEIPHLRGLLSDIDSFEELLFLIDRSVDREGSVLDSASPELREIRERRRNIENRIRKRLDEFIKDKQLSMALQDQYVTLRSGRWVIPLKADFKGKIPGVIHDISRTGETLYVEPLEIIGLANEHENILAEEKAEEIKVLKKIAELIRRDLPQIEKSYESLIYIDLLRSIALFSERFRLEEPVISKDGEMRLVKARHPLLLLLQERGQIDEIVPLALELSDKERTMVITGPNAGGKTIALKTAGLLTAMALSGIPVSTSPGSVIPFVKTIFVDMGDEQSIEESLSTFSGHIKNLSMIIEKGSKDSLILLDELGRATDPSEGAAIACAVLEELHNKGSMIIATTHLVEIALYVHRREGMVNASMEFDDRLLRPLYKLKKGEPGTSHAIEIAVRFGLSPSIIERAKGFLGEGFLEFKGFLKELRRKREFYEREIEELKALERELLLKGDSLKEREEELKRKKDEVLKKALEEAKALLNGTKVLINKLLMEAKKRPKEALKGLKEEEAKIEVALREFKIDEGVFIPEPGSTVYIKSLGYDGTVVRIESKRVRIKAGLFEAEVPLSDIEPPKGISLKIPERVLSFHESVGDALNLTGLKVEEAISGLEQALNHASLSGEAELKIIHGHGTGRLKKAIREYLKAHPLVEGFRAGVPEEGGDGVTVVRMK